MPTHVHYTLQPKIREVLRKFPQGLTEKEIAKRVGYQRNRDLRTQLDAMGDVYIYTWVANTPKFPWKAVWRLVPIPAHAPEPQASPFPPGTKRKPRNFVWPPTK